ncbi:MAG: SDR family oxidoreductase [Hyphomicrobiales bacterium]|nr:SDR family oxidoreductase [Hyphomicrobiales bacterium]
MDLGIKGKTALVFGASQGLGEGIARALAAEGCNLIVGARRTDLLDALARDLAATHGVQVRTQAIDMTDRAAVEDLCARIRDDYRPDILVNNSGGPPPTVSTGVELDVWETSFQSLFFSVIRISEAAVEGMRQRGWGRILTITSSGVVQPIPNMAMSNTVRSSVVAFSKTLAGEVAQDGVTVNVIIPGRIDTVRVGLLDEAAAKRQGKTVDDVRAASRANIPAGRYGRVEEFAAVAAFLVSDPASYVTGTMVRCDGGLIRAV